MLSRALSEPGRFGAPARTGLSAGLRSAVLDSAEALEALAPGWRDLWARCPAATPFQSPEWLLPWWRAFHPGRLVTPAVLEGDRVVAIHLAYVEAGPLGRRLLPLGIGGTDYLDVLVDPERPDAASHLSAALGEIGADLDSIELEDLAAGAAAFAVPAPPGFTETRGAQSCAPALRLARGGDGLATVPSRKRRKLRMAGRRAESRGSLTIRGVREPAAAAVFLAELVRLHELRWRKAGERGVLADPAVRAFLADAVPRLLDAGLARLSLLSIGGVTAGAYFGLGDGRRAYGYLQGYDPAYAHESPGALLVEHAIAEAAREGAAEFHFLRGREAYKAEWGAEDRWTERRSFRRAAA
jgi:CelD/BcsL family acetyltransferase involved in cellulose biosynthesis